MSNVNIGFSGNESEETYENCKTIICEFLLVFTSHIYENHQSGIFVVPSVSTSQINQSFNRIGDNDSSPIIGGLYGTRNDGLDKEIMARSV